MRNSLRQVKTFLLVVGTTLAIVVVTGYVWMQLKMGEANRVLVLRIEGHLIRNYVLVCQENQTHLAHVLAAASNSTEVIAAFSSDMEEGSQQVVREDGSRTIMINPSSNIWSIVKNLPTNAPGQVILVATRNIDARFLRTRMDKEDICKTVPVTFDKDKGLLCKYAIAIRKDGEWVVIKRRVSSSCQFASCGSLYGYKPFGLIAESQNTLHVTYLTPDGEVTPLGR